MTEIHRSDRCIITTDGITAEKSDGAGRVRSMKFYPERDVAALAGEIDELTAWKVLHDVATQAPDCKTPIAPEHILIDADRFVLCEWSESHDFHLTAPEGYCPIWALAATVFYLYLGCHIFHGLGGKGQSATTPIPTLRRDLPELSNLIIKCLDYDHAHRPGMSDIAEIAVRNIDRCKSQQPDLPPLKQISQNNISADEIDTYWPDEMR